jgi:hypothetical protein
MKNVAASVRDRLANQARSSGVPLTALMERFVIGRLLWRVSRSADNRKFVLKGAQLFSLWTNTMHRPTRDLDLLSFGDSSPENVRAYFAGLLAGPADPPDGLIWGTVLPVEQRLMVPAARDLFANGLSLPTLAVAELYGSKLVAAMDRQHPRDLFDVHGLYAGDGLAKQVVDCFVCYLAGHNRPVHEVLFARPLDIAAAFTNEFAGMAREPVALEELLAVRERLRAELPAALSPEHRRFLVSLVEADPDWTAAPRHAIPTSFCFSTISQTDSSLSRRSSNNRTCSA